MKKILLISLLFLFTQCTQKELIFGIAKDVTKKGLETLLETKISLDKDSIFIEKNVLTERACKFLSIELCEKITHTGYLTFQNEKVKTIIFWQKIENDFTKITFLRVKR